MRELFRGYYHPTEAETEHIWKSGQIAVDTNILLNLYKVLPETSRLYLAGFKRKKSQLWLPYQVGFEFHRRVHSGRSELTKSHKNRIDAVDKFLEELRKTETNSRLTSSPLQQEIEAKLSEWRELLDSERSTLANETHHHKPDQLLHDIAELFEGKVGTEPTADQLDTLWQVGSERYAKSIPPGYSDVKDKPEPDRYGDYIFWQQLLDQAKGSESDFILVTDDNKEDWWLKGGSSNKTSLAPRPELIQEFRAVTGKNVIIYNSHQFYTRLMADQANDQASKQAIQDAELDMSTLLRNMQDDADREISIHLESMGRDHESLTGEELWERTYEAVTRKNKRRRVPRIGESAVSGPTIFDMRETLRMNLHELEEQLARLRSTQARREQYLHSADGMSDQDSDDLEARERYSLMAEQFRNIRRRINEFELDSTAARSALANLNKVIHSEQDLEN